MSAIPLTLITNSLLWTIRKLPMIFWTAQQRIRLGTRGAMVGPGTDGNADRMRQEAEETGAMDRNGCKVSVIGNGEL